MGWASSSSLPSFSSGKHSGEKIKKTQISEWKKMADRFPARRESDSRWREGRRLNWAAVALACTYVHSGLARPWLDLGWFSLKPAWRRLEDGGNARRRRRVGGRSLRRSHDWTTGDSVNFLDGGEEKPTNLISPPSRGRKP